MILTSPFPLLLLLLLFLFFFTTPTSSQTKTKTKKIPDEKHIQDIIQWLQSKGGSFHPQISIRRSDPTDPHSFFGMFADAPISHKEILFTIPPECLLSNQGTKAQEIERKYYDSEMQCGTIYNLLEEFKKVLQEEEEVTSDYDPFVRYLLSRPPGQLPSAWSESGKHLLENVVIGEALPPFGATSWLDDNEDDEDDIYDCGMNTNPQYKFAALQVIQRGWDHVLIPIYDMMNHRNGKWLNSECNSVHNGQMVIVRASRDIEGGEEIYGSYNQCEDCGGRWNSYGTPEILRDYGFVEDYPRRWIFMYGVAASDNEEDDDDDEVVSFDIDQDDDGKLKVGWFDGKPSELGVVFLSQELKRLISVEEFILMEQSNVPKGEYDMIWNYYEALMEAMELAIADVTGGDFEQCLSTEGTCLPPPESR